MADGRIFYADENQGFVLANHNGTQVIARLEDGGLCLPSGGRELKVQPGTLKHLPSPGRMIHFSEPRQIEGEPYQIAEAWTTDVEYSLAAHAAEGRQSRSLFYTTSIVRRG